MPTRVILELKYIHSAEVYIHVDAMIMHHGSPGSYISADGARVNSESDPFSEIGSKLLEALSTLSGVQVLYGQYSMMVKTPAIFNLQDTLWDILQKIATVLDDDISFATTLGDDAFTVPVFITNPSHEAFDENINTMVAELRQRKSRDIVEAERTVEHLVRVLQEGDRIRRQQYS